MMHGRILLSLLVLVAAATPRSFAAPDTPDDINSIKSKRPPAKATRPKPARPRTKAKPAPRKIAAPKRSVAAKSTVASKRTSPTLTVAQDGKGSFRTIGDALKKAPPGARVRISAGVYAEALVLNRPVELTVVGGDDVLIEGAGTPALTIRSKGVTIRGLHFHAAGSSSALTSVVDVAQGDPVFTNCDVTGGGRAAVLVHGAEAAPVLRKTTIHQSPGDGVVFEEHARGTMEDCELFEAHGAGLRLLQGSDPLLKNCRIHTHQQDGVFVDGESRGRLEGCDIFGNQFWGVGVVSGTPTLYHCRIHDGPNGVTFTGKSHGTMVGCELSSEAAIGVLISQDAAPTLRGTRILDQKGSGIGWSDRAAGLIEDCDFAGSREWPCVAIGGSAAPTLRRCKVHDGSREGCSIEVEASPTLIDCQCFNNAKNNIQAKGKSHPQLIGGAIHHGGAMGVQLLDQATVTLRGLEITENAQCGVRLEEGTSANLRGCTVARNQWDGIYLNHASGTLDNCAMLKNGLSGISVEHQANLIVRKCRSMEGNRIGLSVADGSHALVIDSEISGNVKANVSSTVKGEPRLSATHTN